MSKFLEDASRLNLHDGSYVQVTSRRGRVTVRLKLSPSIQPGQVFMPMHYLETNNLTFPAFDPYSAEPGYKYSAVRIESVVETQPVSKGNEGGHNG